MIIDFYNKDVANAKFKICWGVGHCTPVFTLEIGAMASYDLSFSHTIQPGTQCEVYEWNDTTSNFYKAITFIYENGKKADETFNYIFSNLVHKAGFSMAGRLNSLLIKLRAAVSLR